jgi:hypothetical protein
MPVGFIKVGATTVSACDDDVVAIGQQYRTARNKYIGIGRTAGLPYAVSSGTLEDMQATAIRGRPAVIVNTRTPNERLLIHMRDGFSHWYVTSVGTGVGLEELIKVAEGVR